MRSAERSLSERVGLSFPVPALRERPHSRVSGLGVAVNLNAALMVSRGHGPHPWRPRRRPIREQDVTYDLAVSEDVMVVAECLLEQQVVISALCGALTTKPRRPGAAAGKGAPA
jgi:hypothetical protein